MEPPASQGAHWSHRGLSRRFCLPFSALVHNSALRWGEVGVLPPFLLARKRGGNRKRLSVLSFWNSTLRLYPTSSPSGCLELPSPKTNLPSAYSLCFEAGRPPGGPASSLLLSLSSPTPGSGSQTSRYQVPWGRASPWSCHAEWLPADAVRGGQAPCRFPPLCGAGEPRSGLPRRECSASFQALRFIKISLVAFLNVV